MRKLVTGIDAAGRSCLAECMDVAPEDLGIPGLKLLVAYSSGPQLPPRPPASSAGGLLEGMDAAAAQWTVVDWEPGELADMHHTNTLDFGAVLSGSGELLLEDGDHKVGVGDLIVVTGVNHGWRSGPEGLVLSGISIAIPAPS